MIFVEEIAALPAPRLLALDVDGTLAPIVDDPAAARVPPETRALLAALADAEGVVLALVTGRDADSLEALCPLPVWRAVEHGRVVLAPGARSSEVPLDPGLAAALEAFAADALARFPAAHLETKPRSRAVHVRGLEGGEAILAEAKELAERHGLHPRLGRAVLEAEAETGDKGTALATLAERTGAASLIYAGDDLTDLPAIAVAASRGVGLFVRSEERNEVPPETTGSLDVVEAVRAWLAALVRKLA